jgi:DNA-binding PadR family transcriptional regulator
MKKLLLLGLLRGQKLHGYGVVEYLNNHTAGGAAISKSNAYRLLQVMEDGGLIQSVTERHGNRPERHVYEVTPAGETFFQDSLLTQLANDATADQPGISILNYLDEVDPAAAAEQLQLRRDKVTARYEQLENLPEDVLHLHPAFDLNLKQLMLELDWLDAKLQELRKRAVAAA